VISRFVQEIPRELLEWEEARAPGPSAAPAWRRDGAPHSHPRRPAATTSHARRDDTADVEYDDDGVSADTPLRLAALARADRRVGQRVRHEQFGDGVVLSAEESGDDIKYTVRFGTKIKKVLGRFLGGPRGS
jgi:hypothetical protein